MSYEMLLSKGKIGGMETKNRVVMSPMGTMLASAGSEVTDHLIRYHEERAKGGVGLIITELTIVDGRHGGGMGAEHLRIDGNRFIPMFNRLADTVHKHDAKIFMQLHHAGRQTRSIFINGNQPVAPSPIPCKLLGEQPRVLTVEEIKELVEKFVMGAFNAQMAGMDGVEVHGAHGFLINQFLSPYTNQRDDEYGGTFEKRLRFLTEIVEGIKSTCGRFFPVTVRISAEEFVKGGIDLNMGKEISKYLADVGVDGLHVSAGIYESVSTILEPMPYEQGWRVYLAEAIKKVVDVPVITVGVIREPDYAENILKEDKADFVALGRAHLADPEWVIKIVEGREKEIKKCIGCGYCIKGVVDARHISCAVNARTGRELEFPHLSPAGADRKVVVVGGGPGGMEAARVLALRGYKVVLFEEKGALGGNLNVANKPLGKNKITWLTDYLSHELQRLRVDVRLNSKASLEVLKEENPYAVILATGSKPLAPEIEGIEGENVFLAEDVLLGKVSMGNGNVAVIGGGFRGCEIAELIAHGGNNTAIVEMAPGIASDADYITSGYLVERLEKENVSILTSHQLIKVSKNKILLRDIEKDEEVEKSYDKVVLALGGRPNDEILDSVLSHFENVKVIGDLKEPRRIGDAIREGFEKAYLI